MTVPENVLNIHYSPGEQSVAVCAVISTLYT